MGYLQNVIEKWKDNKYYKVVFALLCCITNYFVVVLSFKSAPYSKLLNSHDSSMFMYFGKGMSKGLVPYNDMFDHKGIALFWIQEIGAFVGGGNVSTGVWILELLFYLITLIFIFKSAYLLTKNYLVAGFSILLNTGLTLCTMTNGNFSEEFALAFISISIYLLIRQTQIVNKINLFFIGLFGAIVFFMRANMIALWVVFCIYFMITGLLKRQYKILLKQIFWIFLGGFVVCCLVILYGVRENNLQEMFYQTFVLNSKYSGATNVKEIFHTTKSFYELATRTGAIALFTLFILCFFASKKWISKQLITVCNLLIIYLMLNFITVVMSGRFYPHYFVTMLPALTITTAIGIKLFSNLLPGSRISALLYVSLLVLTFAYSYNAFTDFVKPVVWNQNRSEEQYTEKVQAQYIQKHSLITDKIYVHNIDANIYLLSNRFANSKYFVLPSLDYRNFPEINNSFKNSLVDTQPKFISIYKSVYMKESPDNVKMDKIIISDIKRNYKLVPKFSKSSILLFERKNN